MRVYVDLLALLGIGADYLRGPRITRIEIPSNERSYTTSHRDGEDQRYPFPVFLLVYPTPANVKLKSRSGTTLIFWIPRYTNGEIHPVTLYPAILGRRK